MGLTGAPRWGRVGAVSYDRRLDAAPFPVNSNNLQNTIRTDLHVLRRLEGLIRKHRSMRRAAKLLGVSHQFLSLVMKGTRRPGPTIAASLGLDRHVISLPKPGRRGPAPK